MNRLIQKFTRSSLLHPGIRSRFFKALHSKEFKFETEFFGLTYQGNTRSYIDRFVYYMGAYELGILNLIEGLAKQYEISTFLDIGANVGHHSLFASTIFESVHSFEPYPKVVEQFRRNVERNSIENVEIHQFGIGEVDDELEYYEPQGENQGTGSFLGNFSPNNEYKNLKLQVKNGSFLKTFKLNKAILKIDTEGFEAQVLNGIKDFLVETPSVIIVEISRAEEVNESLANFIEVHYNIFHIENQFKSKVDSVPKEKLVGRDTYFLLVDKRLR